ncbi:hypothetical protein L208DRAFT_1294489, partial [Tricholoma matsutake]
EILGDLEFKVPSVSPNKIVSTTSNWSIAWNKTVHTTMFAFPHWSREVSGYGETIINLFGVTHVNFHVRVIAFDLGSHHELKLTDLHKFLDLQTSHMDNIGAAVVHTGGMQGPSSPHKKGEACNRWNQGLCTLEDTVCRWMHICNTCKEKGHKSPNCPSKAQA